MAKKKSRADHWRRLIGRCERSGLSAAEFCRREGVVYGTYSWWKQELRRREEKSGPKPSGRTLVPVRVVDRPATRTVVEVAIHGRQVVRIHTDLDVDGLARLVGALESAAC